MGAQSVKIWSSAKGVEPRLHAGNGQERLDLGREMEPALTPCVVKRAHAHAVAGEEQALAACVMYREGEVAIELLNAVRPKLVIEVQNDLGVARCAKAMTAAFKVLAQFDVIEDLAIIGDVELSSALVMGCWPSARSTMERRRWARPTSSSRGCRLRPGRDGRLWRTWPQEALQLPAGEDPLRNSPLFRTFTKSP